MRTERGAKHTRNELAITAARGLCAEFRGRSKSKKKKCVVDISFLNWAQVWRQSSQRSRCYWYCHSLPNWQFRGWLTHSIFLITTWLILVSVLAFQPVQVSVLFCPVHRKHLQKLSTALPTQKRTLLLREQPKRLSKSWTTTASSLAVTFGNEGRNKTYLVRNNGTLCCQPPIKKCGRVPSGFWDFIPNLLCSPFVRSFWAIGGW